MTSWFLVQCSEPPACVAGKKSSTGQNGGANSACQSCSPGKYSPTTFVFIYTPALLLLLLLYIYTYIILYSCFTYNIYNICIICMYWCLEGCSVVGGEGDHTFKWVVSVDYCAAKVCRNTWRCARGRQCGGGCSAALQPACERRDHVRSRCESCSDCQAGNFSTDSSPRACLCTDPCWCCDQENTPP